MRDWKEIAIELVVTFVVVAAILLGCLLTEGCRGAEPIEKFGVPEGTVIKQGKFEFAFDGRTREPRWVLEYLDWDVINAGRAVRNESFTSDERIPKPFRVSDADYAAGGFDRGHLAPADDFGHVDDHAATFLFSNCVPQNSALNRGLWAQLERQIRNSVVRGDRLWVLTLPVFEPRNNRVAYDVIGLHRLAVPTHLAKAVVKDEGGRMKDEKRILHPSSLVLQSWLVPNKIPREAATPDDYRVPLEDLERESGLEIWNALDPDVKHRLATQK